MTHILAALMPTFLSTPSARRATCTQGAVSGFGKYFYPRPPRGGRQVLIDHFEPSLKISIHALREEGDPSRIPSKSRPSIFLSTPSARRATVPGRLAARRRLISIHALREEGDPGHVVLHRRN